MEALGEQGLLEELDGRVSAERPQGATLAYSVVVPLKGTAASLGATLDSLRLSMGATSYPGELLLVLSGDVATTPDPAIGDVSTLRAPLGRSRARNAGWRATGGDVVVFVDADCQVPPSFIGDCVSALRESTAAGVAYRLAVRGTHGGYVHDVLRAHHSWLTRGSGLSLLRTGRFGKFLDTAACAYQRAALSAAEGFDADLDRSEDVDLSYRISQAGGRFTWIEEHEAVKHHDFRSFREVLAWSWSSGRSRAALYRKHLRRGQREEVAGLLLSLRSDLLNAARLPQDFSVRLGLALLLTANRLGSLLSVISSRP